MHIDVCCLYSLLEVGRILIPALSPSLLDIFSSPAASSGSCILVALLKVLSFMDAMRLPGALGFGVVLSRSLDCAPSLFGPAISCESINATEWAAMIRDLELISLVVIGVPKTGGWDVGMVLNRDPLQSNRDDVLPRVLEADVLMLAPLELMRYVSPDAGGVDGTAEVMVLRRDALRELLLPRVIAILMEDVEIHLQPR